MIMAGLPTIQKELMDLAQELEVDQHVHFLGTLGKAELVRALQCLRYFRDDKPPSSDGI